jgi:hypothetical protein
MMVGSPVGITDDTDIVTLLQRCDPHDTDEVIKTMNAAAALILTQRARLANYEAVQAGLERLSHRFEDNLRKVLAE